MTADARSTVPNILVVDDTLENLRLLANLLEGQGYEVRPVTNGRQALQAAEHDPPDLILLDINMPEVDGYEICRRLKLLERVCDVPVIFLTALTDTADKVRAFDAGGVDYVTKPFQFEEVLARVRTHVTLRQARRELTESYLRLQRLEELRDSLVHMVVHDMRSPLMALTMNLEFARDNAAGTLSAEGLDDLNSSIRGALALSAMANELLDVSRLEDGKMPLKLVPTDVAELARLAVNRLAGLDRARTLSVEANGNAWAYCDGDVVRRVVENLVSNAIKHTPAGGRVLVAIGSGATDGRLRVDVHDEGPGVPLEAREKIFEKFGALEAREDRTYHSAGLGLAFCNLAIEAHGGAIGVDSGLTRGSVSWFELPA